MVWFLRRNYPLLVFLCIFNLLFINSVGTIDSYSLAIEQVENTSNNLDTMTYIIQNNGTSDLIALYPKLSEEVEIIEFSVNISGGYELSLISLDDENEKFKLPIINSNFNKIFSPDKSQALLGKKVSFSQNGPDVIADLTNFDIEEFSDYRVGEKGVNGLFDYRIYSQITNSRLRVIETIPSFAITVYAEDLKKEKISYILENEGLIFEGMEKYYSNYYDKNPTDRNLFFEVRERMLPIFLVVIIIIFLNIDLIKMQYREFFGVKKLIGASSRKIFYELCFYTLIQAMIPMFFTFIISQIFIYFDNTYILKVRNSAYMIIFLLNIIVCFSVAINIMKTFNKIEPIILLNMED